MSQRVERLAPTLLHGAAAPPLGGARQEDRMRPKLHRQALVRFATQLSVVGAVCAGASAVLLPSLGGGLAVSAAAGAGGLAVGLRMLQARRPRPRVTAPRVRATV
jgi:hypothetical protein